MEQNCKINPPINFNCWKHHAGFIKKQIQSVQHIQDIDKLKTILLKIGESQMDLYYGNYSPMEISERIVNYLKEKKIYLPERYKDWLTRNEIDYQLINLFDKSVWTLRRGEDAERYVHIHPGRYSPNTRRVKALTLKTAIFTLCCEKLGEPKLTGRELINHIRKKYLNEPPLKSISKDGGLGKLLELLR
ncbi:MAG: hypothetical protein OQK77_06605 [Psychromonas sp.]|nr:hypothetical protein [Psychromonas sp.]